MASDRVGVEGESQQLTIEITPEQDAILERAENELGYDRRFVARQVLAGGVTRLAEELEGADG